MDSSYIRRHNLLERYLQHRLTADELEQFERYMLDNREILDEIEYARGLQEALRSVEPELRSQLIESRKDKGPSRWLFGREYALAVTVLLTVAVAISGSLWLRNRELTDALSATDTLSAEQDPVMIATKLWLGTDRALATDAAGGPPVVEHEPNSAMLLRVVAPYPAAGEFALTIEGRETDFRWSSVATAPGGEIDIVITHVPPGKYWLSIKSTQSAEPPAQFEFEVVPAHD